VGELEPEAQGGRQDKPVTETADVEEGAVEAGM